jgi:hypothetical protein
MRKWVIRSLLVVVASLGLYGAYETAASSRDIKRAHGIMRSCSTRISVVLSHNEYDPANLEKSLRNTNEAIAYVDGLVAGVPLRDEQSLHYLTLCSQTLRADKAFTEAALALALAQGGFAASTSRGGEPDREQRFNELARMRTTLRERLSDLYNESYEMREGETPLAELVDIGSIEHAQQELYLDGGKAD